MQSSSVKKAVLWLVLLATASVTASNDAPGFLVVRQTSPDTDPQCLRYSQIANLSTIGGNSTYRTAFIQASKLGTLTNKILLDTAVKQIPTLMMDPALNQACGNLTDLALTEAATNFTQGIVAQFTGIPAKPGAIDNGLAIPLSVISICLIFFIVMFLMP